MIRLDCPCGKTYVVQDEYAGKRTKCPACQAALVVPTAPAAGADAGAGGKPSPPPWWFDDARQDPSRPAGATPPTPAGAANPAPAPAPAPASGSGTKPKSKSKSRVPVALGGIGLLAVGLAACWAAGLFPGSTEDGGPPPPVTGISSTPAPGGGGTAGASPRSPTIGAPPPAPSPSPGGLDRGPAVAAAGGQVEGSVEARLQLLVPAYFYPAGPGLVEWERLFEAASRVPIVAVANPASGVGERPDPEYVAIIDRAARSGVTVVGYVFTKYGQRPAAEVREEVDRWVDFYPGIRGIFLDAQANQAAFVDHYAALASHVRGAIDDALVVTNPGTTCDEGYADPRVSDVIVIYEGVSGFDRFQLPGWADRASGVRFAALPHQVDAPERMRDYLHLADRRGIDLVYVCGSGFDRLPEFWEDQVESVLRINRGEAP
ncbi:spherulation-specific family 4 protein [Tautonia plasticadhaerens]|uniref:Spherulation-specific family 4 n=1 Tax=Tautonia plasticadhaerens TaxID=2527974 RepID=A0A518H2L4_9BACT|nr:spherulation-specific family 4 protein [Tautonia plasticadhaerens]QDV35057.1 Spherulation-specific family 4 [Tautonia plasticadhaerens]